MAHLSDREHAELLMLYKIAVADIDRAKREQWAQFYAILLAQAGVVGFSTVKFTSPAHIEQAVIGWTVVIGLLLFLLGLNLIVMHQVRLRRLRALVDRYSKSLEQHSRTLLDAPEAQPPFRTAVPILMAFVMLLVFCILTIVVSLKVS